MKAADVFAHHQPTGGSMDNGQHIHLVEDDSGISQLVKDLLQSHGFRVTVSRDAVTMDLALSKTEPDLMILDVMLPGESGVNIARRLFPLRRFPIIMLTAMGEETDRVVGLEVGADDYIVKPFSARELVARIRAVLRRSTDRGPENSIQSRIYMFSGWTLDGARRNLFDPLESIRDHDVF
jgi:two-component system OmpR family response regulator